MGEGAATASLMQGQTNHYNPELQQQLGENYQIVKVLNEKQFIDAMGERATSR